MEGGRKRKRKRGRGWRWRGLFRPCPNHAFASFYFFLSLRLFFWVVPLFGSSSAFFLFPVFIPIVSLGDDGEKQNGLPQPGGGAPHGFAGVGRGGGGTCRRGGNQAAEWIQRLHKNTHVPCLLIRPPATHPAAPTWPQPRSPETQRTHAPGRPIPHSACRHAITPPRAWLRLYQCEYRHLNVLEPAHGHSPPPTTWNVAAIPRCRLRTIAATRAVMTIYALCCSTERSLAVPNPGRYTGSSPHTVAESY